MDPIVKIAEFREKINKAKIEKAIAKEKDSSISLELKNLCGTDDIDKIKSLINEKTERIETLKQERDLSIETLEKELEKYGLNDN